MSVTAILAAAGRGVRFGKPKQLLDLGGKPIAAWSLEVFDRVPAIDGIYIACEPDERERFESVAAQYAPSKRCVVVAGGATRQASVHAALSRIQPSPEVVLIHDGARPFLTAEVVDRVLAAVKHGISAIAAVPVKDTIKRADGMAVERTIERESLWAAQTPQVFPYDILVAAHTRAVAENWSATDDSSLVERLGAPVKLVMGSYDNIKITTPEDYELARSLASNGQALRR